MLVPSVHSIHSRVGNLCWSNEAGGFTFSRDDVLSMTITEMDSFIRIANERRKQYSDAIKKANRKKR